VKPTEDNLLIAFPDNYSDVVVVGSGGMGTVFKAREENMDRAVAIKIVRKEQFGESELKRFLAEAKALAKLNHPNIIKVHGIGQLTDATPYMVLEYVDGESLDKVLTDRGPLPHEEAMRLFQQVASALVHAHEQAIVHRDIKPSNLIVTKDAGGNVAYRLLDFGIARFMGHITQNLTKSGAMVGSPAYASPEQCTGASVDHRSDIYSLGCMMYEAVAGHAPFEGDSPMHVMMLHCTAEPEPIEGVDAGLERIIRKCMMKKPEDRFADAEALMAALQAGDTTVTIASPQVKERLRVNLTVLLAGACLVVVTMLALGSLYMRRDPTPEKVIDPTLPERMAFLGKEKRHQAFDAEHKGNKVLEKELHEEAARKFRTAVAAAEPGDCRRSGYYYDLGHEQLMLGQHADAETSFRHAIKVVEDLKRVKLDKVHYINCLTSLGTALGQQYKRAEQRRAYETALEQALPIKDPKILWSIYFNLGQVKFQDQLYEDAEKDFETSLAMFTKARLDRDDGYANALFYLARTKAILRKYKDANAVLHQAKQLNHELGEVQAEKQVDDAIVEFRQQESAWNKQTGKSK
jgi:tRNA A-37 threonylcarbamoyl transferase component Bud32/tetratricopeptide (TPR) repeat protein